MKGHKYIAWINGQSVAAGSARDPVEHRALIHERDRAKDAIARAEGE